MPSARRNYPTDIRTGSATMIVLLVCLIVINILAGGLRLRYDLTEEKLYTLSDGTRNILAGLERPVNITFYFSRSLPELPTAIRTYARRVEDFLYEYDQAGGNLLQIDIVDPRPDTESEEWALRHGIEGYPVDHAGNRLFLGMTILSGDTRTVIPMLDPTMEETLEYEITRRILRVSRDTRPMVGLISRLPVMGRQQLPYMMPGMQQPASRPAWTAFQELERDFEIRELSPPLESIDPELACLLIVHPPELDDLSLLAIDQYLLRGGAIIAFLDPYSVAEQEGTAESQPHVGTQPHTASELEPLTSAWGIGWTKDELVIDIESATQVQGANGQIEENPMLISLFGDAFEPGEILTAGLDHILLPLTGHFNVSAVDGLDYQTILRSSPNAMVTDPMTVRFGLRTVLQQFEPRQEPFILALRVQGIFPTAFPDGITLQEDPEEDEPDLSDEIGDLDGDAQRDESATLVQRLPQYSESIQSGAVILTGDVDMLYDAYAVRRNPFFATRAMQPINNNIHYFLHAVDQAAGGVDLLGIRARGRSARPFTRVLDLEREARVRWVDEEQRLQQQLRETERRLNQLRAETDEAQDVFLTAEQRREIARFREEQSRTQAALREVRKNLREDIERLGLRLKIVNIGLVPLLVILGGITFALTRQYRMARRES